MSNGGTGGILSALVAIGAAGRVEDGEKEQAEMFEADAAMPSMFAPQAGSATRSGPRGGRPAGSRNKSTEAWRELFLSKFRHPMMVLGELTSRTPEQLARELKLYKFHEGKLVLAPVLDANGVHLLDEVTGEKRWQPVLATGEAAKMQQDAATALLPYLGQKLPMAIEVSAPQRGVVVIGELPIGGEQGELDVPFAPDDQPQQNQQVIDAEVVRLDEEKSDEKPKPKNTLGDFTDDV